MRALLLWSAAAVFAAGIFILSAMPDLMPPGPQVPGIDKAAHAVVYFLFAAVLWSALRASNAKRACLLAVLIAAAYGASDEFHQHFVPGRMMSFFDWLADVVGASLWMIALRAGERRATPAPRRPTP